MISQSDRPFNSTTQSAQPGQVIILWGTGLGPVSGDEAGGPLPGNIPGLDIHVYVAGVEAQIQYSGRSGCCVGDDQIVFVVPAGVQGCALPVYVQIGAVISNFVTMAVGPDASSCPNPDALSGSLLATAQKNGGLTIGEVSVSRNIGIQADGTMHRNDNVSAVFEFDPLVYFEPGAAVAAVTPVGACTVIQFPGSAGAGGVGGALPKGLAAGNVSAATPVGTYPVPPTQGQPGYYGLVFFPGYPSPAPAGIINNGTVLTPGTTVFSWTGEGSIGAGQASIDFPLTFMWTNEASVTTIDTSQPLTITWSGGTKGATLYIYIQSSAAIGIGAELTCAADATLGTFTIPSSLLAALPPSIVVSNISMASIALTESFVGSFTAPGIDLGQTLFDDGVDKGGIVVQ